MKELIVFILGMTPISELRGAIPFGLSVGVPLKTTVILALVGNLLPIIPLLLFLEAVSAWIIKHSKLFNSFFAWVFERTRKHSAWVERFEAFGLFLVAAIPIPPLGTYSACAAAFLFGINFWRAFLAIALGVLASCVLVLLVLFGAVNLGAFGKLLLR